MLRPNVIIKGFLAALLTVSLGACGKSNDSAPSFDASTGKHSDNWVVNHRAAYHVNAPQCWECHGADLLGGISKVGCTSTSFDGMTCHAGGHPPRNVTHALPFKDPSLHGPAAKQDLIDCQDCHGQPGGPGSNPRFNLPIGSLPTGCEASGCHLVNMAHPKPWSDHETAGNLTNACALCHGATFGGGTGPACSRCHTALKPGTVPILGTCVSCHGNPPNGTSFPNIAGAHFKHNNLTGVTGVCNTCHNGAGFGTPLHFNNMTANVAFLSSYNAKSGAASYNKINQTCSNVSCHGAIQTPPWQTGVITVSTDCTSCHTLGTAPQTPQFNSYFSGEHAFHVAPPPVGQVGLRCTDCHDLAKLASPTPPSHFSGLATPDFELDPELTIRADVHFVNGSCTPQNTGTNFSIGVCHFSNPKPWGGP